MRIAKKICYFLLKNHLMSYLEAIMWVFNLASRRNL